MLGLGKLQWGDLDSMIARRRIRALVPYTHTFYFIDGKERRGLAFEALNLFEKALNKQLKFNPPKVRIVFIPVNREQIIPLLQEGYGDLAVAGLTITSEREKMIDFSIPTITGLNEILVGGPEAPPLHALSDLAGQWVYIHEGSSYNASLQRLSDSLQSAGYGAIRIEAVDPDLEVEDVLEMVYAGLLPFTVVEEDVARHWATVLDSLKMYPQLPVNTNLSYGWAMRKGSPQLKAAVDQFIRQNRKGTLTGNTLYNRYLKNTKYVQNAHSPKALKQLQATEAIFKKYGEKYDLDWLLLVAQGYQESQLNQQAVSKAGAVGIMQIKPSTAAGDPINIKDVKI
jgi:membrane-bound lytic murein transglycosylase MltF